MQYLLSPDQKALELPVGELRFPALLTRPKKPRALILFVPGWKSSRFSTRSLFLSRELNRCHFATLLFDLLTPQENNEDLLSGKFSFDLKLTSGRLSAITSHLSACLKLKIGYFGNSTGGAAALMATLKQKLPKVTVLSSARLDLIFSQLPEVRAKTCLIAAGAAPVHLHLNRRAYRRLKCLKKLKIIPGATQLFEETGKLEEAAKTAREWFEKHL
ncbi:MAG: alpha/beta hydrolase [Parachlamydiales bacterium]|jgi:hypothetical protein